MRNEPLKCFIRASSDEDYVSLVDTNIMNFEPLQDEDSDAPKLSPYIPAEIRRMQEELKNNRAKARLLRFELEHKRRFRDTEETKQRKIVDVLQKDVENLELIRKNMETKANDRRRDEDMKQIGELLLQLSHAEQELIKAKSKVFDDKAELKLQDKRLRAVEREFRQAPDDINAVALKKKQTVESRFLTIQRQHNRLRKQAEDAKNQVRDGMKERQNFSEAYSRIERQYTQNTTILNRMLSEISTLNDQRAEFLKKAAQNREASNESKDEVINKLRHLEKMANLERETRILTVCRAIDRTPYWKNEALTAAIKSYHQQPIPPSLTMLATKDLEATLATIRQITGEDDISQVIKLYEKREENNELLTEKLKDLNREAECVVDQIETSYKSLQNIEQSTQAYECKLEKKIMLLLERTEMVEKNSQGCQESLDAFKRFYEDLGPKMTAVHELMFNLIPHSDDLKPPDQPCNASNYNEYQMSFSRLAHYFHAVFDYWKQQEHEKKSRTDPSYTGTNEDDHPLALQEIPLSRNDYPVPAKLKLLPRDLRCYRGRHQFENEDGTTAVMSVKSMEFFAKTEAEQLGRKQFEYLEQLDQANVADQVVPRVEVPYIMCQPHSPEHHNPTAQWQDVSVDEQQQQALEQEDADYNYAVRTVEEILEESGKQVELST